MKSLKVREVYCVKALFWNWQDYKFYYNYK